MIADLKNQLVFRSISLHVVDEEIDLDFESRWIHEALLIFQLVNIVIYLSRLLKES